MTEPMEKKKKRKKKPELKTEPVRKKKSKWSKVAAGTVYRSLMCV